MQYKSNKTLHLNKVFGEEVAELRKKNFKDKSRLMFCYEYDLDAGNLSRIENGIIDTKLSMLWRISESLGVPLSEIFKSIEQKLGENFRLLDE
jgi:transcriptional regulator with XRE-family HTH domain